jgi:hypothetical protein
MVESEQSLVPSALKRKVEVALNEASIYEINSYGWISENDPDPEFIGHAMWQVDQPPLDHSALFGEAPVHRRPKDIEKELLVCGEDFSGLMEMARLSIGLALIWKSQAQENPINESSFFWLHHTDSFLKLAMASDRLRDLLIIACTGTRARRYDEAAVLISRRGISGQHLDQPLSTLPVIARDLAKFRDRRNVIVHEVATRMAKFVGEAATRLQKRFDQEQTKLSFPTKANASERLSRAKRRKAEIESEIECATEDLKDWYRLLIQASNSVFQVEYWTRRYEAIRMPASAQVLRKE